MEEFLKEEAFKLGLEQKDFQATESQPVAASGHIWETSGHLEECDLSPTVTQERDQVDKSLE